MERVARAAAKVAVPNAGLGLVLPEVLPEAEPMPGGMADWHFDLVRRLASEHAGIAIADYKRSMVRRRVDSRVRALGLPSEAAYCALIKSPAGATEIQALINALTTNKTEFFREAHHFDHLARVALPRLVAEKQRTGSRRLRLWSAGCSTGQEAYSLAATVDGVLGSTPGWDVKILATDIDTEVLARARCGSYSLAELDSLPAELRARYTRPAPGDPDERTITPALKQMIVFKHLNLNGPWPMRGPFDVIFCRNVVIYFDKEHQRRLVERFAGLLPARGLLYCGHSESLIGISSRFRPVGKSLYERLP